MNRLSDAGSIPAWSIGKTLEKSRVFLFAVKSEVKSPYYCNFRRYYPGIEEKWKIRCYISEISEDVTPGVKKNRKSVALFLQY